VQVREGLRLINYEKLLDMKIVRILALGFCVLIFSQCKSIAPTAPSENTPSLLEVEQILASTHDRFLLEADSTNGDPWKALMLTANWVQKQPTVQTVATIDSAYINIVLKSGLTATYFFDPVDDSGRTIFRGGGPRTPPKSPKLVGTLSKNSIKNKKVLLYAPAYTEFHLQPTIQKTIDSLSSAGLGLVVTLLKDEECTPAILSTFGNYGLVIMDTHGSPESFMSGTIIDIHDGDTTDARYRNAVILQAGQDVYDRLLTKDLSIHAQTNISILTPNWQKRQNLNRIEKVYVTTNYIRSQPSMPNTVIFGNMCYSGFGTPDAARNILYPMRTAFLDKNPISYYGYTLENGSSEVVTDNFAKEMEETFVQRLANDNDSTGNANLRKSDDAEFFDTYLDAFIFNLRSKHITLLFRHWGADDYSYDRGCVSQFTDGRDGQVYKAVCIGDQNWMAQNLNYNAPGSVTYNNDPANGAIYGRLYNFQTFMQGAAPSTAEPSGVQGVCPKGWHVPSDAEWSTLFVALGDSGGGAIKSTSSLWSSPNFGATNRSGFSALPGGESADLAIPDAFGEIGNLAVFGTTTTLTASSGDWSTWGVLASSNTLDTFQELQKGAVSCRCVKDK
jgi:uncharacterized protein (TIGR02145 family)